MIDDALFVTDTLTPLSEGEATYYLREAFKSVVGSYPSVKSLALLWAHSALEVGRWKAIHNNNWGNIKKIDGQKYTSFRCSEILNGKEVFFNPPHPQTLFASWDTPLEGAVAYLSFVKNKKRYQKAWEQIIVGDPSKYSHELKVAGYYTANEARYTEMVVKLTKEFSSKSGKLLEWRPPVVISVPEKTAVEQAEVPIFVPDLRSGPKEEDPIQLEVPKNWLELVLRFLGKLLRRK